ARPQSTPTNHSNLSDTLAPFGSGHSVKRITLVLALEAQLPTGCHSRSTPPGHKSRPGACRAGRVRCSRRGGRIENVNRRIDLPASVEAARTLDAEERVHRSLENA